jgi:hypothetical protein
MTGSLADASPAPGRRARGGDLLVESKRLGERRAELSGGLVLGPANAGMPTPAFAPRRYSPCSARNNYNGGQ